MVVHEAECSTCNNKLKVIACELDFRSRLRVRTERCACCCETAEESGRVAGVAEEKARSTPKQ